MRTRLLLTAALLLACHRYEVRSLECPPDSPPPSSRLRGEYAAAPGAVSGRVLHADATRPVPGATVRLDALSVARSAIPGGPLGALTDSAGTFRLDGAAPGPYRVTVRALGYVAAVDTVSVTAARALVLDVGLQPHVITLDGCGYAQIRVRKPWWKWW
jgi:hypothetical protein